MSPNYLLIISNVFNKYYTNCNQTNYKTDICKKYDDYILGKWSYIEKNIYFPSKTLIKLIL